MSPRMRATRRQPRTKVTRDIDEQTRLGEVYIRSLISAQARLAIVTCAVFGCLLGGLPLLFALLPEMGSIRLLGIPLPWLLLGVVVYPALLAGPGSTCGRPSATSASSPSWSSAREHAATGSSPWWWSHWATILVGAYGLRISRTTSDFYVASRTVSPGWNASAIGGEYLSAASFLGIAGLILAYGAGHAVVPGRLHRGLPGAAVLVAAPLRRPARTRCRTSPRPGSSRGPCAGSRACWWCSSAGSTCCRSCRAPA